MPSICILTDNTTQFPAPAFQGRDLVHTIPLQVLVHGPREGDSLEARDFPGAPPSRVHPEVQPPSVDEFRRAFAYLARQYQEIVVILLSSHLSEAFPHAQVAARTFPESARLHLIDSQTAAIGQGLLVQAAAAAAASGVNGKEIKRILLGLIPHIYSVFAIQGLSYLCQANYLGQAQAIVGEMLGVIPFFMMDSGKLVPTQKIRNSRQLVDLLHEFVLEFSHLSHIALLQGDPPFEHETRALRERLQIDFAEVAVSEHNMNAPLAAILGPRTLGVFVWEHSVYGP